MSRKNYKIFQVFLVSVSIFLFSYIFLRLFFANFDGEFLYFFKKVFPEKISKNIIVVEIDDLTLNKLGYPFDRSNYLPFLDNIKKASPAVIGFDILFLDKGTDIKKDNELAKKFKEMGNVIIGFDIKDGINAIMPYDIFYKSMDIVGYFKPTVSDLTNKVYSLRPFQYLNLNGKKTPYESFSFVLLRKFHNYIYGEKNYEIKSISNSNTYNFFQTQVPIKYGEFYINYSNPKNFSRESFYNVYNGTFNKELFKDKIVIVGYTAEGIKDDFYIPGFSHLGPIKGVYIHANTINNVLNENYIVYFNEKLELLIGFLFIFLLVYFNIFYLNLNLRWLAYGAVFLFILIFILYFIIFFISYKTSGVYLLPNYPFEFASILFLSFFVSSVFKYADEDKNKKLLSRALSEYVSSDIVSEILNSTGNINLSGENKKITMFFSDIKGFTTISEKMQAEELLSFLRIYLSDMSNIIIDNKGFINKYEGDAIMALWGVFGIIENYGSYEACFSAIEQQNKIDILNNDFQEKIGEKIQVRMGLHVGNAIIGNIGAQGKKMEFTALGDNVNLASRLEGVNKFYGTNICVSQDLYDIVKDKFIFRYLDKIKVKGKNNAINIYELIGYLGKISDLKKQIIDDFDIAIKYYFSKKFDLAIKIFEKLSLLGDNPSKVYFERCSSFLINNPGENWDGINVLDEK